MCRLEPPLCTNQAPATPEFFFLRDFDLVYHYNFLCVSACVCIWVPFIQWNSNRDPFNQTDPWNLFSTSTRAPCYRERLAVCQLLQQQTNARSAIHQAANAVAKVAPTGRQNCIIIKPISKFAIFNLSPRLHGFGHLSQAHFPHKHGVSVSQPNRLFRGSFFLHFTVIDVVGGAIHCLLMHFKF